MIYDTVYYNTQQYFSRIIFLLSTATFSCMTTVSAELGRAAPVDIRTASPAFKTGL